VPTSVNTVTAQASVPRPHIITEAADLVSGTCFVHHVTIDLSVDNGRPRIMGLATLCIAWRHFDNVSHAGMRKWRSVCRAL